MSIDPKGRCMRACVAANKSVRASKRAVGFLRCIGLQCPRGLPREFDDCTDQVVLTLDNLSVLVSLPVDPEVAP